MLKDKELMKSFTWSFLVHGTLVVLLLLNGFRFASEGGAQQAQEQADLAKQEAQSPVEVEIIDKPKKSEETAKKEEEGDGLLARAPHLLDECPDFFGGIGITENSGYRSANDPTIVTWVSQVHKGYPAEKAGIQMYDEVLNSQSIRGEIGTEVTVQIVRNGTPMEFTMIRDKICTTDPKKPGTEGDNP